MSKGSSGMSTWSAPPAMPAVTAIQPTWWPMTSTTMIRSCDSAVVRTRSSASVAMETAVSKPIDRSVPQTSLSIVLGAHTMRTPAAASVPAALRVPSPPTQTSASMRSCLTVSRTASMPPSASSGW